MEFRAKAIVDNLIDGVLISINGWYKLCCLEFQHGRSSKDSSVEQKCFDQNSSVHRVGKPPRVDGRRLEWIGRLDVACASGKWVHDRDCKTAGIVVDDLVRGYCLLCQSTGQ